MRTEVLEKPFSRFARHGRLHRLYVECGDEEGAKEHLAACRRLKPEDEELATSWARLFGLAPEALRS